MLLTNAHVQMTLVVFSCFLKKVKRDKMAAVTHLGNTEAGHFRGFNEKLMTMKQHFGFCLQYK